MTLHPGTGTLTLERLGPSDLVDLFGFLDRDPVLNVYLLALALRDALAQPREEFWAARRGAAIVALLHLGGASGAILPVGDDREALERLADRAVERRSSLPRRTQIIGPRAVVDLLVRRLRAEGIAPRLWRSQVYLAMRRGDLQPFDRLPELRPTRPEDFALVFDSGARLRAEELDEDPRVIDPAAYARRVEEECHDGYTWLWVDAAGLCFRASVSARSADTAQIAGVYTPPERRNQGLARRGLSELSARLFERNSTVCLFVNDFNAPALALYRRMGFRPVADWASAFYDSGT